MNHRPSNPPAGHAKLNLNPMRLVTLALFTMVSLFGWGKTGHRITGQIAENHLTPKAFQAVRDLLGAESLAEASTWADEIRSDPAWAKSEPWHYVNIPDSVSYEDAPKNPGGDVIAALRNMEATLRNPEASKQERIEALRFFLHFAGDLHQPLHAGHAEDLGGNRVQVRWFRNVEPTNLHSVWDSSLIDQEQLSFTEFADFLDRASPEEIHTWQSGSYTGWMEESQKALPQVYDFARDKPLSFGYVYKNMPLVKRRLLHAGIRIAGVLNDIYR